MKYAVRSGKFESKDKFLKPFKWIGVTIASGEMYPNGPGGFSKGQGGHDKAVGTRLIS